MQTSASSADSYMWGNEAAFWSKWVFQLIGTFTGYSVTIYGTIDPQAGLLWQEYVQGGWTTDPRTLLPTTSWVPIVCPASSDTDDTFDFHNPLTATAQFLYTPVPLVAVRAFATGSGQTGNLTVLAMAVP